MILSRRGLITGLASLVAAPAIVRASSLMPVKVWGDELPSFVGRFHGVDLWPGALNFVPDDEVRLVVTADQLDRFVGAGFGKPSDYILLRPIPLTAQRS